MTENLPTLRLHPCWREYVKIASMWEHGSIHTHEEIAEIMGLPYPSAEYYSSVHRGNEELVYSGILVKSARGVGYRVYTRNEQVAESVYVSKRGISKIKKGIEIIANVPMRDTTDMEARRIEATHLSLAHVYKTAVSGISETAAIAGIDVRQKMLKHADEIKTKGE